MMMMMMMMMMMETMVIEVVIELKTVVYSFHHNGGGIMGVNVRSNKKILEIATLKIVIPASMAATGEPSDTCGL